MEENNQQKKKMQNNASQMNAVISKANNSGNHKTQSRKPTLNSFPPLNSIAANSFTSSHRLEISPSFSLIALFRGLLPFFFDCLTLLFFLFLSRQNEIGYWCE